MPTIRRHACNLAPRLVVSIALAVMLRGVATAQQPNSQAAPKPKWPDNGVAQRTFPNGSTMFVENDHGKWRVWVLSQSQDENIEALDFFSGEHLKVKVKYDSAGYQEEEFVDAKGRVHKAAFNFNGHFKDPRPGGYVPGVLLNDDDGPLIRMESSDRACSIRLYTSGSFKESPKKWQKVPMFHYDPRTPGCPSGRWDSLINTALDLEDGTFLATTPCWVFRLRNTDLTPASAAPALHVVDANAVNGAIAKARGQAVTDATAYLAEALHLPIDPSTSCKEE